MWSRIALIGAACAAILSVAFLLGEWFGHPGRITKVAQPAGIAGKPSSDIRIDFGGKAKGPSVSIGLADDGVAGTFAGEITTLVPRPILFVDGETNVSNGQATPALQRSYAKIRAFIAAHHLTAAGPPIAINEDFDTARQIWKYRAGIPLVAAPETPPGPGEGIVLGTTFRGAAVRFVHRGDPNQAQSTYGKIDIWMKMKGLSASGPTWEEYTSDPQTPVSNQRTNIYVPIG